MQKVTGFSITIANPTPEQFKAIRAILGGAAPTEESGKRRGRPKKTVSEEETEEFGTEGGMEEEELEEEEEAEEAEEAEESVEEEAEEGEGEEQENEEGEEEEKSLSFDDVRGALNKLGEKHPKEAKAILLSFNIKSTKELHGLKKKWEPVYRRVQSKIKALTVGKKK